MNKNGGQRRRFIKKQAMSRHEKQHSKGKVIILSGPSGAGKTTIHERILSSERLKGQVVRSVSMTTRSPRPGEKQGREYFFVSKKMFEHKIRSGQFLEWAKVFNQYYGTPGKAVRALINKGKTVLLCIDVQGARKVMRACPQAVSIFIKTPSFQELKRRLTERGSESHQELDVRLKIAQKELEQVKYYDRVIINDDLQKACQEVETLIVKYINNIL